MFAASKCMSILLTLIAMSNVACLAHQIEDLESRQRSLLAQKSDAETLLASSSAQVCI